jgi:hypothetical protein
VRLRPSRPGWGAFFETINKHRKALDLAIEESFGGELGPAEWRAAFDSIAPCDANRTMVVTGDHSAVLNAILLPKPAKSSPNRRDP